jgi:hypothetical protein
MNTTSMITGITTRKDLMTLVSMEIKERITSKLKNKVRKCKVTRMTLTKRKPKSLMNGLFSKEKLKSVIMS